MVRGVIDKEGCLVDTQVVQAGRPDADRRTLEWTRGWVFRPATLNGEPVSTIYTLTLAYNTMPKRASPP